MSPEGKADMYWHGNTKNSKENQKHFLKHHLFQNYYHVPRDAHALHDVHVLRDVHALHNHDLTKNKYKIGNFIS